MLALDGKPGTHHDPVQLPGGQSRADPGQLALEDSELLSAKFWPPRPAPSAPHSVRRRPSSCVMGGPDVGARTARGDGVVVTAIAGNGYAGVLLTGEVSGRAWIAGEGLSAPVRVYPPRDCPKGRRPPPEPPSRDPDVRDIPPRDPCKPTRIEAYGMFVAHLS
jgi:hypothetical protein